MEWHISTDVCPVSKRSPSSLCPPQEGGGEHNARIPRRIKQEMVGVNG